MKPDWLARYGEEEEDGEEKLAQQLQWHNSNGQMVIDFYFILVLV